MTLSRIAAAALSLVLASSACATRPAAEPTRVFLLMGQSNMSGRGDASEAPPGALDSDPRILLLGNDGSVRVAEEPIDSAIGQLDAVSADPSAGVGPGLAFAKAVIEASPGAPILLVPCAKGGSAIAAWRPALGVDTLYGSCLARAKAASEVGAISGALWHQGESDAETSDSARAWPQAFRALVERLRSDLDPPDLPFVFVTIGDEPLHGRFAGRFAAWTELQRAQDAIQLRCAQSVAAAGLPRTADDLHLSTAGQLKLGALMAAAWISLTHDCHMRGDG